MYAIFNLKTLTMESIVLTFINLLINFWFIVFTLVYSKILTSDALKTKLIFKMFLLLILK